MYYYNTGKYSPATGYHKSCWHHNLSTGLNFGKGDSWQLYKVRTAVLLYSESNETALGIFHNNSHSPTDNYPDYHRQYSTDREDSSS